MVVGSNGFGLPTVLQSGPLQLRDTHSKAVGANGHDGVALASCIVVTIVLVVVSGKRGGEPGQPQQSQRERLPRRGRASSLLHRKVPALHLFLHRVGNPVSGAARLGGGGGGGGSRCHRRCHRRCRLLGRSRVCCGPWVGGFPTSLVACDWDNGSDSDRECAIQDAPGQDPSEPLHGILVVDQLCTSTRLCMCMCMCMAIVPVLEARHRPRQAKPGAIVPVGIGAPRTRSQFRGPVVAESVREIHQPALEGGQRRCGPVPVAISIVVSTTPGFRIQ
mmetsp:Transcript_17233/g.47483  ORF Transcript_17233/g.47483 Transcript_17233/m.47483 type:complete len:276 (-) Transcript_17233:492-1319(-)